MDVFFKACSGVLISVILILTLDGRSKEISAELTVLTCVMTAFAALEFLRPVITFLRSLETLGNMDHETVKTVMKSAGIGIVAESAALICADAGSGSLAKMIRLLANCAIVWLSLPLFHALIDVIRQLLGEL